MDGTHTVGRRGPRVGAVVAAAVVLAAITIGVAVQSPGDADRPAGAATGSAATSSPAAPGATLDITDASGRTTPKYGVLTIGQLQAEAPGTTVTLRTLTVGAAKRAYVVIAPKDQRSALPMLVVTGGVNASATAEAQRDEFIPLAQRQEAVLVYPVSYEESWNAGNCCGAAYQAKIDDVAFVQAVATDAQRHLSVVAARTYLVGFSNGGKLAYALHCSGSSPFAAFAVVAATPSTTCATRTTGTPTPFLLSAGTADVKELPLKGHARPPLEEISRTAGIWRARDGCSSTPTASRTLASATIITYGACSSGSPVETVVYDGLAHLWPSSARVGAAAGAPLIWAFLSQFTRA